jgi:hypothetical protein
MGCGLNQKTADYDNGKWCRAVAQATKLRAKLKRSVALWCDDNSDVSGAIYRPQAVNLRLGTPVFQMDLLLVTDSRFSTLLYDTE